MELNTAIISRLEEKTGIQYLGLIRQEEYKSLQKKSQKKHTKGTYGASDFIDRLFSVDYCYCLQESTGFVFEGAHVSFA